MVLKRCNDFRSDVHIYSATEQNNDRECTPMFAWYCLQMGETSGTNESNNTEITWTTQEVKWPQKVTATAFNWSQWAFRWFLYISKSWTRSNEGEGSISDYADMWNKKVVYEASSHGKTWMRKTNNELHLKLNLMIVPFL